MLHTDFKQKPQIRITAIYVFVASLWILFSDSILYAIFTEDVERLPMFSMMKGLTFIAVTGGLLYSLLHREFNLRNERERTLQAEIERRIQYQNEFTESEGRFRKAVEEAPLPIVIFDEDGRIVFISRSWMEITGYKAEQLQTIESWTKLAYGERQTQIKSVIDRLFDLEKRVDEGEFVIRCADGTERTWLFSSTPLGISDGKRIVMSIASDITELADVKGKLENRKKQLRQLAKKLVDIQEVERREIARELHDEIGQTLTGLSLSLEMFLRANPEQQALDAHKLQEMVNSLMKRVREISLDLRPAMLDDLGLLPALSWFFTRYEQRTGIEVRFQHEGVNRRFERDIETSIYRIIQESLTNTARYAQVKDVDVDLWANDNKISLQIEDRGKGFDPDASDKNITTAGLIGMRERAYNLQGQFIIDSRIGRGTTIIAEIPLQIDVKNGSMA